MKITGVRVLGVRSCRVPSNLPHLTLIEVLSDAGITGIGATWYAHHKVAPLLTDGHDALERLVIGRDPRQIRRTWDELYRLQCIDGALAIGALGAIDMALWDIAGKAAGAPLHTLLGGALHSRIMAYASSSAFLSSSYEGSGPWQMKSAAQLAAECRIYVQEGFRAVKFGWGNNFSPADEERLAAIREAIGPDVKLMIDFGSPAYWSPAWNATAAVRAARLLERYDVYFFEEPMPPFDVEGHATVAASANINISTGESLAAYHDFEAYIDRRAVDVIQPDAMQMGITQLERIARRAQDAGMLCIPHSPWSVFAATCHLQVLSTVNNGPLIEYPAFASFEPGSALSRSTFTSHYEIVETPPRLVDGFLELPTGPGLGLGAFVPDGIARLASLHDGAAAQ